MVQSIAKPRGIRSLVGIVGIVVVTMAHFFMFNAAVRGAGDISRRDQPDAVGSGANVGEADSAGGERRITVRILTSNEAEARSAPPDAYLQRAIDQPVKLEISGPDALPIPPLNLLKDGEASESTDAELIAMAELMGVYESQIRARIERVWTLPQDFLQAGEIIQCGALVRQSRDGYVVEVELPYEGCVGSHLARQSVVDAIFKATPLPAPPHPDLFVDSFTLVLNSEVIRRRLESTR